MLQPSAYAGKRKKSWVSRFLAIPCKQLSQKCCTTSRGELRKNRRTYRCTSAVANLHAARLLTNAWRRVFYYHDVLVAYDTPVVVAK